MQKTQQKKKEQSFYKQCIDIWFDYYKDQTGIKYIFSQKCGANLKKLIKAFEDPEEFKEFLYSIKNEWVLDKLTVSIVLMKINELRQQQIAKPKPKEVYHPPVYTEEDIRQQVEMQRIYQDMKPNPEA